MKKTFKTALSLLFALIFVLSVGISAYAEDAPTIEIGGSEVSGSVNRSTLLSGVDVYPGQGYYVDSLTINGIDVIGYAYADRNTALHLSEDAIKDIFSDISALDLASSYTVAATIEEFPFTVDVSVNHGSSVTKGIGEVSTPAADNSRLSSGLAFDHWFVTYDNGVSMELDANVDFTPFMDCDISAEYYPIYAITFKADTTEKRFDNDASIPQGVSVTSVMYDGSSVDPSAVSLSGVSLSIDDRWVGTHELHVDTSGASVVAGSSPLGVGEYTLSCSSTSFEIKGRELVVKAKSVEKEYDGGALYGDLEAVNGLLGGDYINFCVYDNATYLPCDRTYVASDFSGIVIKDSGNNDVTYLYEIVCDDSAPATYKIKASSALKFKFAAKDATSPYTGKPVDGSWKLVSGNADLLKDLKIDPTFKYVGDEHTNVGKRDYVIESVAIFNSKDEDITGGFTLEYDNTAASLEITQQELKITVKEATKEYDGSYLSASDCTVQGLLDGHTVDKSSIVYTGTVMIGSGESNINKSSVKIYDAGSNDVTASYKITVVPGKLTVTPLKFTITAKSLTKTYDGTPLVADNSYEALTTEDQAKLTAVGWHLDVATSGSQTHIGESDVIISKLDVLDSYNSKIDSKYYEANMKPGTLKVLRDPFKKTVTITIDSATKVYDGTPLEVDPAGYTISDNLDNGYSIFVVPDPTYITSAGSIKIGVKEYEIYKNGVLVTDESTVPFNIEIKTGTLTVNKYPIKITAKSGSKAYDGKELVVNSCTITATNNQLANPSHQPTVTIEAQDDSGNKVQAIKVGKYNNVITKVVIKDGNKDVTSNYEITTVNGTLTIRNGNGNPQTGDNSNISLWATVLAVSAVAVICLAVVFFLRGKKKGNM